MLLRTIILTLITLPALAQKSDGPIFETVEQAIETSSAATRITASVPSTLLTKQCDTCAAQSLQITRTTQFFIGTVSVTQPVFVNSYAKQSNPASFVIFFDPKSQAVTRVVASPGTVQVPVQPSRN